MKFIVLLLATIALVIGFANAANIRASTGSEETQPEAKEHGTKYSPDLSAHEIATEQEAEVFFQKLIGKTRKIKEGTNAARKQSHDMCVKEVAATKAWIKEGLSYEGEADRKASQDKLKAALEARIAGLKKALARLKKLRRRLYDVIVRVNSIFKSKYLENAEYMKGGLKALHTVGVVTAKAHNPRFNPIKNFKNFTAGQLSQAKAALIELRNRKSTISLSLKQARAMVMTIAQLKHKAVVLDPCKNPNCEKIREESFELYAVSLKLNAQMFENFELERKVLRAFRMGLKALIQDRISKISRLSAQLKRVLAAMARDETFNVGPLEEHLKILNKACPQHEKNAIKEAKAVDELYQVVQENHSPPKKKYHVTDDATGANAETGAATGGN